MLYKSNYPTNWKYLQNEVSQFLNELEFKSYTPYLCENNSISFEIDVYAEKYISSIPINILIECKYWNSLVPQDVVFSMITRVNKYGANLGIIISKAGFQKGSIKSINNTNILLYTYDEFIEYFQSDWLDVQLKNVYNKLMFLDSVEWKCFLNEEEQYGADSDYFNTYGYLELIYANMKSGNCINHKTYSDKMFLSHIPNNIIFPDGRSYKVNVLGDAFRLFLNTNFLTLINKMCMI